MEDKEFWDGIRQKYKLGHRVTGVVEYHAPFGVFLDIGDPVVRGLILITEFPDDVKSPDTFPPIGEKAEGVVLGYTEDERNQVWLSAKPSKLSNAPAN